MKPIFPHIVAGRKANKNTAGTHNLLLWVLSCCVLYGFASFWLSVFSLTCLPMYPETLDSQVNNINKKTIVTLMTNSVFGRSQQSCIANLHAESLPQWRGSIVRKPDMMLLYVTSPLQNVFRTISWPQYLCRYNCTTSHGYLDTARHLLRWRCKSFPHTLKENLCWPLAERRPYLLVADHGVQRYLSIRIKAFSFLCDKFTRICQSCNILFFFPQSL